MTSTKKKVRNLPHVLGAGLQPTTKIGDFYANISLRQETYFTPNQIICLKRFFTKLFLKIMRIYLRQKNLLQQKTCFTPKS